MNYKSFLLFLLIALSSCNQEIVDTNNNSRSLASIESFNSRWPGGNSKFPLSINYGADFTDLEIKALVNSGKSWSDSVNNKIDFFQISNSLITNKKNLDAYDDNELGIYKLSKWPKELPPTALAITQILGEKTTDSKIDIQHADILLNTENFTFTTDESWGYDLETVILHELGHLLGLYHESSSPKESIMYPSISRYVDNKTPKSVDINNIQTKYDIDYSAPAVSASQFYTNRLTTKLTTKKTNSKLTGERIILRLEIHADGKEVFKIKKGDHYEVISTTHVIH